jgi:hypothetical protein
LTLRRDPTSAPAPAEPEDLPMPAPPDRRSLADRIRGRLAWEAYRARLAFNDRVRVPRHDWRVTPHLVPAAGDRPAGPRLAIDAVFSDKGLLPSHVRALDQLASLG